MNFWYNEQDQLFQYSGFHSPVRRDGIRDGFPWLSPSVLLGRLSCIGSPAWSFWPIGGDFFLLLLLRHLWVILAYVWLQDASNQDDMQEESLLLGIHDKE